MPANSTAAVAQKKSLARHSSYIGSNSLHSVLMSKNSSRENRSHGIPASLCTKSLSRCAPAKFITILTNKAVRNGGNVIKVDTFETKASQFDHTDESYTKKKLSERMAHLSSGEVVQRDLYSAFLLEHIDTETLKYDIEALKAAFPAFLKMHENTKKRLQEAESYLPASVGF